MTSVFRSINASTQASKWLSVFVFFVMVVSSLSYYLSQQVLSVITWDVYGYYLYLPAIFKYQDISQFAFTLDHLASYKMSADIYQVYHLDEARSAPLYTIGMAIIYMPFYFVADIIAKLSSYTADGMSLPYQWAIILCCWTWVAMGLYFVRKTLQRLKFGEGIISLAILGIYLGTNLFHYAAFEVGMPHVYLFTLYIALINYTIKWHDQPNAKDTVIIGLIIALLCLCRPSEVISILIPLLYGIKSLKEIPIKIKMLFANGQYVMLLAGVGLLVVSIQLVFWKLGHGSFFFNGYRDHSFDFKSPHIIDGLFSFRKGWLIYSPLIGFGLLGLFFARKNIEELSNSFLVFMLLNIYIIFSWPIWWYASSFGARAVIQSYPILLICFASLCVYLTAKKYYRYFLYATMILFICLNQFQDWQYRRGIVLGDGTTSTYYKATFFETKRDKMMRKYVDSNERIPQSLRSKKGEVLNSKIIVGDEQTVNSKKYSPKLEYGVTRENVESLKDRWIEVESELGYTGDRFDQFSGAKLVMAVRRNDKSIKWVGVRVQRMIEEDIMAKVTFDYQIPSELKAGDVLETYLWNNGPDVLQVKSLKFTLY